MSPMRAERRNFEKLMGGQREPFLRNGSQVTPPKHEGCPFHRSVRDAVVDALTTDGFFEIEDILTSKCKLEVGGTEATFDMTAVDIQWDFIMRSITEDPTFGGSKDRPIPYLGLLAAYFSKAMQKRRADAIARGDRDDVLKIASRMVGSLTSGKLAGYALVMQENADLTQARVVVLDRMTHATGTGCERYVEEAKRTNTQIERAKEPLALPQN